MLKHVEVEGKTTEEAIKIALHKLGAPREKVKIEILSEENKGLFDMKGTKQARIRATLKE